MSLISWNPHITAEVGGVVYYQDSCSRTEAPMHVTGLAHNANKKLSCSPHPSGLARSQGDIPQRPAAARALGAPRGVRTGDLLQSLDHQDGVPAVESEVTYLMVSWLLISHP